MSDLGSDVRSQSSERQQRCRHCAAWFPAGEPVCPVCLTNVGHRESRWKGGPTSFGPATKLVMTLILAAIAIGHAVLMVGTIGGIGWPRSIMVAAGCTIAIGLVWRRTRVR